MKIEISIIIPIYNSEKTIRECIQSIINSDFTKKFEIIVIDDGSTDKSIEKINDLDIILFKQKNKGAAAARNKGASLAKSDILLFVDSDVVFFKDTLKKIYDHLKNDGVDYLSVRYSKKPINKKWIHKYKALADYFYSYDFLYSKSQKKGPIKDVVVVGGTEGYKKSVFFKLGGFDENIKGAGIEREILISKLSKHYQIIGDGNIKTKHNFPDFKSLVKNYFFRAMHSTILMKKKLYNQPYLKKNIPRVLLGSLTTISFFASVFLYIFFHKIIFFIFPVIVFLLYLLYHLKMFISALKEYNLLFMFYMIIMNLFFCLLISFAGFLGTMDNLLKNDKEL
jgi:glycosyltransferase involved in cell wall biosynthesis